MICLSKELTKYEIIKVKKLVSNITINSPFSNTAAKLLFATAKSK